MLSYISDIVISCYRAMCGNKSRSEEAKGGGVSWSSKGCNNGSTSSSSDVGASACLENTTQWPVDDDDLESWLNEDSPYKGMLSKCSKKQTFVGKLPIGREARRSGSGKTKFEKVANSDVDWCKAGWDAEVSSSDRQAEQVPFSAPYSEPVSSAGIQSCANDTTGWDDDSWAQDDDEGDDDDWQAISLTS